MFRKYEVIHKSLRKLSTSAAQQPRQTQQKGACKYVENLSKFVCVMGAVAYFQVLPLGSSRDQTWRGQGIRKRSVCWNLPKLSVL
jgi:hypothetical protein